MPDNRIQILEELQHLTGSQAALLRCLTELNLISTTKVEELISQLTKDRFKKAQAYLKFAHQLNLQREEEQAHIVSRIYYAMYHAARAIVLHTQRMDVDDHKKLATAFGQIAGGSWEDILTEWRKLRNRLDYSPYLPPDLSSICLKALDDGEKIIYFCREYLEKRGVRF